MTIIYIMENKFYLYEKISHFHDTMIKINNEPNKKIVYTDEQFKKDFEKWISDSKHIKFI